MKCGPLFKIVPAGKSDQYLISNERLIKHKGFLVGHLPFCLSRRDLRMPPDNLILIAGFDRKEIFICKHIGKVADWCNFPRFSCSGSLLFLAIPQPKIWYKNRPETQVEWKWHTLCSRATLFHGTLNIGKYPLLKIPTYRADITQKGKTTGRA